MVYNSFFIQKVTLKVENVHPSHVKTFYQHVC